MAEEALEELLEELTIAALRTALLQATNEPAWSSECRQLFAQSPEESDELLARLFAEFDAGMDNGDCIRMLLDLQRSLGIFELPARPAALDRASVRQRAWHYAPTCRLAMFMRLLGVVRLQEPSAPCANMVREYPEVASALLARLVREQKHDHFHHAQPSTPYHRPIHDEVDVLRSMLARNQSCSILDEIETGMQS